MTAPVISLRDYQNDLTSNVRELLRESNRVIAQAPTGAGKTVLAAFMISGSVAQGLRCYFIVHRQELVDQTAATFDEIGIAYSYIAAGYPYDPNCGVQICSMDTLVRRFERMPHPDLAIVDEAHHAIAATWKRVLDYWPEALVVGLSATPERLDGRGLGQFFERLAEGPLVFDLITDGWLSEYDLIAPPTGIDTSKCHTIGGDFNKKELAEVMDDADLIGDIVTHWELHAKGLKTIGFAVNVAHSKHICEAFKACGIDARHLDAKTGKKKRRASLRAFALGEFDVLWNVGLFSEGFDLEKNAGVACTVEAVICARPTQSLTIWLQQVGRALRKKDRKAVILDHAGNVWVHGLPCAEREWSLESKKRKSGIAPVKQCPACFAVVPAGVTRCGRCDYVWPQTEGRELTAVDGKLEVLDIKGMRARKLAELARFKYEEQSCKTFDQLVALGTRRKYRWPYRWAARRWKGATCSWCAKPLPAGQRRYCGLDCKAAMRKERA